MINFKSHVFVTPGSLPLVGCFLTDSCVGKRASNVLCAAHEEVEGLAYGTSWVDDEGNGGSWVLEKVEGCEAVRLVAWVGGDSGEVTLYLFRLFLACAANFILLFWLGLAFGMFAVRYCYKKTEWKAKKYVHSLTSEKQQVVQLRLNTQT